MDSSVEGPEELPSYETQQTKSPDNGAEKAQQIDDKSTLTTKIEEKKMSIVVHEGASQDLDDGDCVTQVDKEASILSVNPVKVSLGTTVTSAQPLQSVKDGRSPAIREKVLEDGYNWRKYGQKLVKGNEFIRSYYRCTHPSCQVKKQLERSHEGQLADIVYFGQHDHPKPQSNIPVAVGFVLSVEDRPESPLSPVAKVAGKGRPPINSPNALQMSTLTSREDVKVVPPESTRKRDEIDNNDDDLQLKRQKKGNRNVDPAAVDKPTGEPRVVVKTLSEEDIVNDGYRWRKYGQKMVKGNPNPRSYYRCSSPGCPVKKHVERASHDPKVVITSYEGEHDHDMPPSRTVTNNIAGLEIRTPSLASGQLDSKPAFNTPDANIKTKEQLNGESSSKAKGGTVKEVDKGSDMVSPHSSSLDETKSKDQQNEKSCAMEESDAAGHDSDATTSFILEGRTNDQHTCESKEISEVNGSASNVHSVASHPDSKSTQPHISDSEPVEAN
ncbi:WRKY transcription factor 1 [Linum perenne]